MRFEAMVEAATMIGNKGAAAMTADAVSKVGPSALRAACPTGRAACTTVLSAPFEPRTYLRALHLLLMFLLGIAYFVVFVTLFSVGFALIWTFVGPAVLLVALYATRWFGDAEAWMARHVGGIELRRPPTAIERGLSFRTQVKTHLTDPTTWTGLLYLVLRFPLGIAAFVMLVRMTTAGGVLVVAPPWSWVTGEPLQLFDTTEVVGSMRVARLTERGGRASGRSAREPPGGTSPPPRPSPFEGEGAETGGGSTPR